jgi:hypothetical protein
MSMITVQAFKTAMAVQEREKQALRLDLRAARWATQQAKTRASIREWTMAGAGFMAGVIVACAVVRALMAGGVL